MGKAKKIGIGFGIVILGFFVIAILAAIGSQTQEQSLKVPELSQAEIKAQAQSDVNYDDLLRNNANYVNVIVHYKGKILQTQNVFGDTYALRIGVTESTFIWSNPIWVNYAGPRVLENDVVEFWGKVKGIKSYTAVLGQPVEIPEVDAMILEVIKKQG